MVVKKRFAILISILSIFSILLIGCSDDKTAENQNSSSNSNDDQKVSIGISQIVEHPALDAAREGFIAALDSKGFKDGENLEVDYQNAQGDMPTAQTIANDFVSSKKDLILAIATPTAQAAYNVTKDIPIAITAVTDPVEAGLVKSWDKSNTNVFGTSDATPADKQFKLIQELFPNAKNIGIIYNTSETNSEIQVEKVKKIAADLGLNIITSGVTNVNEISQSLDSITNDIDVLYTPTDNTVASSMPLIVDRCTEKNIPVIGAEKAHVEAGALATEGIDYYKLGFETGLIAVKVLEGESPEDMPISTLKNTELAINLKTAKMLDLNIPTDIKDNAILIGEE
ncbi:ABC transporter substrate-binding protein [Clostridiisalibacter paucivorans]|uniref:ABC transporter substrate-binding protein n=1 Tax=Clostridiisalibacter paucivorans TaxID=408753 RepID=UPI000478F42E|nr:ABC transporter substrate-binding protein [Clostridiisalibacter paucivorans]